MQTEMLDYVKELFEKKYQNFGLHLKDYKNLKKFKISENINETGQSISPEVHYIMRLQAEFYLNKVFESLLIDQEDENIKVDRSAGNIGTVGRIIKTWTGSNPDDDCELMSGRWNKEPRMASFKSDETKSPVYVKVSLDAVCSHHFIRFGDDDSDEGSFAVVGYFPEDEFGGISKINRYVRWCASRGWLQESLTNYIGKKVEEKFKTNSVYVGIFNAKHGCASSRGAMDRNASTSTIYTSGWFNENYDLIPQKYKG